MATLNLFNESVYLDLNPDVRAAVQQGLIEARTHFEQFGRDEGRMASYLFNPADYLAMHQDVAQVVAQGWMNVYQHFETYGLAENRAPFSGFDVNHYLTENPDVAAAVQAGLTTAVQHFMLSGFNEIRNFNPDFDIHEYLAANPGAAAAIQAGQASPAALLIQQFTTAGGGAAGGGSPGAVPGTGGDLGDFEGVFASLIAMLTGLGMASINVEEIQNLVLNSGLLAPENLNPDGSGLIDPQPLVDLIWGHFYGTGSPLDIIGGLPALPDGGFPGIG